MKKYNVQPTVWDIKTPLGRVGIDLIGARNFSSKPNSNDFDHQVVVALNFKDKKDIPFLKEEIEKELDKATI